MWAGCLLVSIDGERLRWQGKIEKFGDGLVERGASSRRNQAER